jgi:hypothetical protein
VKKLLTQKSLSPPAFGIRIATLTERKKSNPSGLLHTLGGLIPMADALVEVRLGAGSSDKWAIAGCFSAAIARSLAIRFCPDVRLTPSGGATIFLP